MCATGWTGCGPGSVQLLQRAVGVDHDGRTGPITQAAIQAADPASLARDYQLVRLRYFHDIVTGDRSQRVFVLGWVARINELFEGSAPRSTKRPTSKDGVGRSAGGCAHSRTRSNACPFADLSVGPGIIAS